MGGPPGRSRAVGLAAPARAAPARGAARRARARPRLRRRPLRRRAARRRRRARRRRARRGGAAAGAPQRARRRPAARRGRRHAPARTTARSTSSGARRCSSTSPDTIAFLTEIRRVLRRGGRLLVTVPGHGRFKRTLIALGHHDAHYDPLGQHVRFYTRRSLAPGAARHRLLRRADRRARRPAAAAQRARRPRGQGLAGGSAAGWPFARLASRKSELDAGLRGSRK